jgi:diguanylate cyclase (GGDEF)-like protein/PAS domain S-box-containing protein
LIAQKQALYLLEGIKMTRKRAKKGEQTRICEKDYLKNLVALCPDGIIAVNRFGTVTLFNRAAEELIGHKARDVVGKANITDVYKSEQIARDVKKAIYADKFGGAGRLENYEVELEGRQGKKIPIRLSAVLIVKNGEEVGSVGFFHDQTMRKAMEQRLRHLSITDSLTGLYNQRYFYTCLMRELDRAERYQRPISLICFDLDRFKQCNDLFGHLEGDNVLRLVGGLLCDVLRRTDMAFRYGGDEFFILLPETPLASAQTTCEKIRNLFNERWPYTVAYKGVRFDPVTLSIGVAQALPGESGEEVIQRADLAMYDAKRNGGDQVAVAQNVNRS